MRLDAPEPIIPADALGGARPFGFHAPPWASYVVADNDGMVWAFEHCPVPDSFTRSWTSGAATGRNVLLGSCRQEIANWEDVILHRRGGLWRSLRAELEDERDADFHSATSGTLWAIAMLALLVLLILTVDAAFL